MKTINVFKRLLLTFILVFAFSSIYGQSTGIKIYNNTSCHFLVEVVAADASCNGCYPAAVCIAPGSVVLVPACGGSTWEWSKAKVIPADQNCKPCPNNPVFVSAPGTACPAHPTVDSGKHCTCGIFEVVFASSNVIEIN
jgi:hypothetical protein